MTGTFFGVSLGPVKKSFILPRAFEVLAEADVVYLMTRENTRTYELVRDLIGHDKTIRLFMPPNLRWGEWGGDPVHVEIAEEVRGHVSEGRNVALIAFGDIAVYSPYNYMAEHLEARGVRCELVPGIPYFLAASGATGDYLVRDDGNMLIAGYENVRDLDRAFISASTVVLYATNRDAVAHVRRYVQANALPYAKMVKIGAEGEHDEVWDLTDPDVSPGSGVVVLKRHPEDRRVLRPTVIADGSGAAPHGELVEAVMKEGIYRQVDGVDLRYTGFFPDKRDSPVLLLFHGGGWQVGARQQFIPHGEALSSLGMALITFDYRIKSKHDANPAQSVEDARAAVAWTLEHAAELGIDPDRIIVGGASAGGHLALGAFTLPGHEELTARLPMPRAFVLFNPVSDTTENGYGFEYLKENGLDPASLDLNVNIAGPVSPTIIFHGARDALVPVQNSYDLKRLLEQAGTDVGFHVFASLPHGFFNHRFQGTNRWYYDCLERIVDFLAARQVLPADARTGIRILNAADRSAAAWDVAHGYKEVAAGLQSVEDKLSEMQAEIQELAEDPARAADMKRMVNNVRALLAKLNTIKRTHEYCGIDA